jgi:hypothetical protein
MKMKWADTKGLGYINGRDSGKGDKKKSLTVEKSSY